MKLLKFVGTGIFFGVVMVKSEAVSWYRIQEMFRFQSFHMYGIIGVAVLVGILAVYVIKKLKMKDIDGNVIQFRTKRGAWHSYLLGGGIFGLGWALVGACPGPIFVNIGYGYLSMVIVAIGALIGTYGYGWIKSLTASKS